MLRASRNVDEKWNCCYKYFRYNNDGEPWVKKEGGSFYVTMEAYDGAEVCELIGIYMLYLIGKKYDSKNIGLYRDDRLAAIKNVSGPASEKIKKQLQSLFK